MKIATFGGLIFELAWEKFPRGLTLLTPLLSFSRSEIGYFGWRQKKVDKGDGHAERDAQSVRLFAEG